MMADEENLKENYVQSVLESVLSLPDGDAIFPEKYRIESYNVANNEINTTKRKQLHSLSLETKVQVIRDSEAGCSHRKLAMKYKCGKTQIGNIVKQKKELLKEYATCANRGRKRRRSEPYEEVNNMVWEWYQEAKRKELPINGPILQAKAKEYASLLEIPTFSASNGWLDSFRKRHDISFRKASSKELVLVTPDHGEVHEWKYRIASILKEYSPRDIFNLHETGLLFRTVPSEKLLNKSQLCKNDDLANEKLSIALCCNAIGEKENPLIISNHFLPWYLKEIDTSKLGIKWHCNEKAWLTEDILKEFLQGLNDKMKSECRKIVLFTGDITCHLSTIELSHVSVKLLPSCSISLSQPLDLGVISTFKLSYRKKLLKTLVARVDSHSDITKVAKQINVVQAIKWAVSSWIDVQPEVITKCFKMSGIMCEGKPPAYVINDCDAEFMNLCELAGISNSAENIRCFNALEDLERSLLPKALSLPNLEDSVENIQFIKSENDKKNDYDNNDLPLEDSLKAVSQLRKVLHTHSNASDLSRLFDAVDLIEAELENIIVNKKLEMNLLQKS